MSLKEKGIGNGVVNAVFNGVGIDFEYPNGEGVFIIDIPEDGTVLRVLWNNGTTNQLTYPKGKIEALAKKIFYDEANTITSCNVIV